MDVRKDGEDVVKRSRLIRADPAYIKLRDKLKREISSDLTDAKITRGISNFLVEEDLLPHMIRRAKKDKRRRRLF